jgi:hypothetical protein
MEMVGDSTRMDFLSYSVVAAAARGLGASGCCRRCFQVNSDEMDVFLCSRKLDFSDGVDVQQVFVTIA